MCQVQCFAKLHFMWWVNFCVKKSYRFDDDRLMLVFIFFKNHARVGYIFKDLHFESHSFSYPVKGYEEDYKDERVSGFWQSYPFIVRS